MSAASKHARRARFAAAVGILALAVLGLHRLRAAADEPVEKPANAPILDVDAMVELPGGAFTMGEEGLDPRPYGDAWSIDQTPAHEVTLSTFRIDPREVTAAEFALFLTHAAGEAHFRDEQPIERVEQGYLPIAGAEDEPVRHVTWRAARDYCAWAGKRLPTEAEWERAASGLEGRPFPWGEDGADCTRAAHYDGRSFCVEGVTPVGAHPEGATPEGVDDLAGNVAEWVADVYGPYPSAAQSDPTGPAEGDYRVLRGGGFLDGGRSLRARARRAAPELGHAADVGFRCAWRDDVSELADARRGLLEPAPDSGREPGPPPPERAPEPEVLASGLSAPGDLLVDGDLIYVADPGAGRVVSVGPSGEVTAVADGLDDPAGLAVDLTGALWIAERGGGRVLRVTGGGAAETIASGEDAPDRIVAIDGEVLWSTAGAVRRWVDGAASIEEVIGGLAGVSALRVDDAYVWVAEESTGGRMLRVPRGGGAAETLFTLSASLRITDAAPASDGIWVGLRLDGFPNSSVVCVAPRDGGDPSCGRYGPVRIGRLALSDDEVLWTTNWIVARSDRASATPYGVIGAFTAPAALAVDGGYVHWTDGRAGRVLRAPL